MGEWEVEGEEMETETAEVRHKILSCRLGIDGLILGVVCHVDVGDTRISIHCNT